MSSYISAELRRRVAERAHLLCEYCLIHEEDTFYGCQIDHIISEKHGGSSDFDNLAYACAICNQAKGSDIASLSTESNTLTRFFNPHADRWTDHFRLSQSLIVPKTAIGEVTARILAFNVDERRIERELLIRYGRYPSAAAAEMAQE